ncbi:MAG: hypothetical protein ACI8RZ_005340 [Myxococcota bacterium]|jgi:hypothetical protein
MLHAVSRYPSPPQDEDCEVTTRPRWSYLISAPLCVAVSISYDRLIAAHYDLIAVALTLPPLLFGLAMSRVPSLVHPVSREELEGMKTWALMAQRKRMLKCEESPEFSDLQPGDVVDPTVIRFKNDPRWREMYKALKAVLATREVVSDGWVSDVYEVVLKLICVRTWSLRTPMPTEFRKVPVGDGLIAVPGRGVETGGGCRSRSGGYLLSY